MQTIVFFFNIKLEKKEMNFRKRDISISVNTVSKKRTQNDTQTQISLYVGFATLV